VQILYRRRPRLAKSRTNLESLVETTFELHGYTLVIQGQYRDPGSRSNQSDVDLSKFVTLQAIEHSLDGTSRNIFFWMIEPSHARAIASAILAAATKPKL
jgi:hypothetical protein